MAYLKKISQAVFMGLFGAMVTCALWLPHIEPLGLSFEKIGHFWYLPAMFGGITGIAFGYVIFKTKNNTTEVLE